MINPLDRNLIPQEPVVKMIDDWRKSTRLLRTEIGTLKTSSPEVCSKLTHLVDSISRDMENDFREYYDRAPRTLPYVSPENVRAYKPLTYSFGDRVKILFTGKP